MRRPTGLLGLTALLFRRVVPRWLRVAAALALGVVSLAAWCAMRHGPATRDALPTAAHHAWAPVLVWNGTGYGAAWIEAESDAPYAKRHVHFASLGEAGRRVGALTRISLDDRFHGDPRLAWSGSEYGLAFAAWNNSKRDQRYEIHFARLAPDGRVTGAPRLLSPPRVFSREPQLTFARGTFRVAWTQFIPDCGMAFGRLTTDGAWADAPRVVPSDSPQGPRLSVEGGRDVLAWSEMHLRDEVPHVVRVAYFDGARRDDVTFELSRPYVDGLVLSRDGETTAFAWRRFDPQGQGATWIESAAATPGGVSRPPREVLRHPVIGGLTGAVGSAGVVLAWSSIVARESGLYTALIAPDGTLRSEPRRVDDGTRFAGAPSLTWNGHAYGALWVDGRDGGARVYFATLDARGARVGPAVPVSE